MSAGSTSELATRVLENLLSGSNQDKPRKMYRKTFVSTLLRHWLIPFYYPANPVMQLIRWSEHAGLTCIHCTYAYAVLFGYKQKIHSKQRILHTWKSRNERPGSSRGRITGSCAGETEIGAVSRRVTMGSLRKQADGTLGFRADALVARDDG